MAIFKYLPRERGLRVLTECELMVTPPKWLNDPFECSPVIKCKDPEAYASRRIDEIMGSPEFFETHRTQFPDLTFEDFQRGLHENRSQLLERLVAGTSGVDSHIQDLAQEIVSKNFGVICFAADGLHQTMWAHYASSHEGLVIEFRSSHQLFSGPSFFEMEYSDEPAVFDPSNRAERDEARRFLIRKGLRWSSERESRLLVELSKATIRNVPEGDRYFIPIEPEIIISVTLGLRATNETQDALIELLHAPHFENVGLFKITKNTEAGTFERERLRALRNS
jgi:Protein of unknown function (DUF2971).